MDLFIVKYEDKEMVRFTTLLATPLLLSAYVGVIDAEIISGTISGQIQDFDDGSLVCALVIINGSYQTYTCTTDGTNKGAPFTLHYNYFTDSADTSVNKLLIFADQHINKTIQITQPDTTLTISMTKTVSDSLVGEWSIWSVDGGKLSRILPFHLIDYLPPTGGLKATFSIDTDDGSTVKGGWSEPVSIYDCPPVHGGCRLPTIITANYDLTATYNDDSTLHWTMTKWLQGHPFPECTTTGIMKLNGINFITVTPDANEQCRDFNENSEYWVRYSR